MWYIVLFHLQIICLINSHLSIILSLPWYTVLHLAASHNNHNNHKALRWRHSGSDSVSNHSLTIVYSTVYSDADLSIHQSSASLAFVRGIHRWPVNSPHKWPVTRKMFPFDDVIMESVLPISSSPSFQPNTRVHTQTTIVAYIILTPFSTENSGQFY